MENISDVQTTKMGLIVSYKNDRQKELILETLPNNLTCECYSALSGMIVETNENNQTIYRSRERLKLILADENKIYIESEEDKNFIYACAFLNDFEIEYILDNIKDELLIELSKTVTYENIDEIIEYTFF